MSTDLDTLLTAEQPESTPETTGEKAQRARDEAGRFAKEEVAAPETPVEVQAKPEEAKPETRDREAEGYKAAMMEERRKRQELEARLNRQPEPELPKFWDDPEAAVEARIERRANELQQDYLNRYYNALESTARSRHPDYDKVRDVFIEHARQNPALAAQMNQVSDPAEYAYQQGKLLAELSSVGNDFGAYRQKLEAEIRQKIAAEARPNVPRSLNSEPSAPVVGSGAWAPASLEDILPHKF